MNKEKTFSATVIGAGSAGLSIVGRLLSANVKPILWIDPQFEGGRMIDYQKVPANTKTKFFLNFMSECPTYEEFLKEKNPDLNPLEIFKNENPEGQSFLDRAYFMCKSLTQNIALKHKDSTKLLKGTVDKLTLKNSNSSQRFWEIKLNTQEKYYSDKIILATGAKPRTIDFLNKPQIPLEVLVNDDPDKLSTYVTENDVVGVFGSSHSSILALKHLEHMPNSPKKIYCFYKEKIRYAVHTEKGIFYDNFGLKGQAAIWAKDYLEAGRSKIIEMHHMINDETEKEVYKKYVPDCTKFAATIGFERCVAPVIDIEKNDGQIEVHQKITYDGTNLRISKIEGNEPLYNMWGIGIGFPRIVRDLSGDMGFDVGVYKFGNAAKVIAEQISPTCKF